MVNIFDGKKLAEEVKSDLRERVKRLQTEYGRVPCLSVVLVGDDYGSRRYASSIEKNAATTGLRCRVLRMDGECTEEAVLAQIRALNADKEVDGILIQLPLPQHISQERVLSTLSSEKDVDGVTACNVARLWTEKRTDYSRFSVPCTARSAMRILEASSIELAGKHAVIAGRSPIAGLPIAKLLMNANATVTVAHSHTRDLSSVLRGADIIVSAIGQARFITADMVLEGAVVVDVGINKVQNQMCGDVDFEHVAPKCSLITPVPGGVGPLTICSLLENTTDCFLRRIAERQE